MAGSISLSSYLACCFFCCSCCNELRMWNAVEHLACGAGLVNIYDFLRVANPSGRPSSQLQQERDPPSVGKGAMLVSASSVNKHPYLLGSDHSILPICPTFSFTYPAVLPPTWASLLWLLLSYPPCFPIVSRAACAVKSGLMHLPVYFSVCSQLALWW